MLLYIALGFVVVVVAVIIWLYTSVARGVNKLYYRSIDTIEPDDVVPEG